MHDISSDSPTKLFTRLTTKRHESQTDRHHHCRRK